MSVRADLPALSRLLGRYYECNNTSPQMVVMLSIGIMCRIGTHSRVAAVQGVGRQLFVLPTTGGTKWINGATQRIEPMAMEVVIQQ